MPSVLPTHHEHCKRQKINHETASSMQAHTLFCRYPTILNNIFAVNFQKTSEKVLNFIHKEVKVLVCTFLNEKLVAPLISIM